jgi:hypothetical protein
MPSMYERYRAYAGIITPINLYYSICVVVCLLIAHLPYRDTFIDLLTLDIVTNMYLTQMYLTLFVTFPSINFA